MSVRAPAHGEVSRVAQRQHDRIGLPCPATGRAKISQKWASCQVARAPDTLYQMQRLANHDGDPVALRLLHNSSCQWLKAGTDVWVGLLAGSQTVLNERIRLGLNP